MAEIKKIPCRVCGKLFKPCSYCQSHSEIFRWRNFACSRECAQKYISSTTAYREEKRKNTEAAIVSEKEETIVEKEKSKKTSRKKTVEIPNVTENTVVDVTENHINKETE